MSELGFHVPSLIVYLVNFVILLAVLYVFAYKRILGVLDQRSDRIRDSLEEADKVRQEASQAQEEMRQQMESSRREGSEMLEQARQMAERYRDEQRTRAQQEREEFLERARQEIQRERDAAVEEVRKEFAGLAITAAEQVIERSLDRDAHRDLIEKVLEESSHLRRE